MPTERIIFGIAKCSLVKRARTNLSTLSYQRRSPEGLQTHCQTSRNGKQCRVRFADQVSLMDGESSNSISGWGNSDLIGSSDANYSNCYLHRFTAGTAVTTSTMPVTNPDQLLPMFISSDNNSINNKLSDSHVIANQFSFGYNAHPKMKHDINECYEEDSQSLPRYSVAMTRLRRNDNQWLSHASDPSFRMIRRFHNRSSSLPRGIHRQSTASKTHRGSIDCCYPPQDYSSHMSLLRNRCLKELCPVFIASSKDESYLMRSVDNLSITEKDDGDTRLDGGRRLPDLPPNCAAYDEAAQQSIFGRQRRMRRGGANSRSQSAGRVCRPFDSKTAKNYINNQIPSFHRSNLPSVRARLVALDHRGLRIILIEKLQPGPFGFYIASGILNQKRGIFISRISLPSLTPVLSVGDQIIYVEDELVKGEDLEYVQALIAGKNSVKIVLLPTVGPSAC
ncbi:hypothetical protein DINM_001001 [Dirofilaria immitis]|nr:hypothetical protein [Dirofilaria immitis]